MIKLFDKKRILSILLCIGVCLSNVSFMVFATNTASNNVTIADNKYVLVKTAKEAQAVIDRYHSTVESNITADSDVTVGELEEQQKEQQKEQEQVVPEIVSGFLDGNVVVELLQDGDVGYIATANSPPETKWPANLAAVFNTTYYGKTAVKYVTELPENVAPYAYFVQISQGNTALMYFDTEDSKVIYVYHMTADDTILSEKLAEEQGDTATDNREMTGQVELRPLSEDTINRLVEIRLELESKTHDSWVYKVATVIAHVVGVLFIIYGGLFIIAYIMDMFNPFQIEFEFFYFITFTKWHSAYCADGLDLDMFSAIGAKNVMSLIRALILCAVYILIGVLLLTVDWIGIASYVYAIISGG